MANELSGEERLIARYFRPLAKHPAPCHVVLRRVLARPVGAFV